MGWVHANAVEKAGKYLVKRLVEDDAKEMAILYSEFYGPDVDTAALNEACGFDADDEEAHLYIEWAAYQLEDQGLVTISSERLAGDTLMDGESDYAIQMTNKFHELLAAGGKPVYRDMDL